MLIVSAQTLEIGSQALLLLTERWVGTLTPSEAAGIAQKAGKVYDSTVRSAGAELAVSVLSHANSLGVNEITNCLEQCGEQSNEVLERACKCVELAHDQASPVSGSAVAPQILFKVTPSVEFLCIHRIFTSSHVLQVARYYKKLHDLVGADGNLATQQQQHQRSGRNSQAGQRNNVSTFGATPRNPSSAIAGMPRSVNISEESQIQASYEMVQQDLQDFLLHQFIYPANVLLAPDHHFAMLPNQQPALLPSLNPAAQPQLFLRPRNLHPTLATQPAVSLLANQAIPAARLPLNPRTHLEGIVPNRGRGVSETFANAGPPNSVVTHTRFSKKAFSNGLEAVKTIIRRNADSKEEFMLDKGLEHEEDLKWLIGLTIQFARPDYHKMLVECVCSGGLKNPFLLHSLTDFALYQLQQIMTRPAGFVSDLVNFSDPNLARQHYLYISMSGATWQQLVIHIYIYIPGHDIRNRGQFVINPFISKWLTTKTSQDTIK